MSLFIFLLNRKLTRMDTPSVIAELIISVRGDTEIIISNSSPAKFSIK